MLEKLKTAYERFHAWKNRPPTPEETRAAQAELRAAMVSANGAQRSSTMPQLHAATKALKRARKLDRHAETLDDEGNTLTVDYVSAWVLYLESTIWEIHFNKNLERANANPEANQKNTIRAMGKAERKMRKSAEKAVRYQPNHPFYLLRLAEVYRMHEHKIKARLIVRKILKIDPGNADAIALRHRL